MCAVRIGEKGLTSAWVEANVAVQRVAIIIIKKTERPKTGCCSFASSNGTEVLVVNLTRSELRSFTRPFTTFSGIDKNC